MQMYVNGTDSGNHKATIVLQVGLPVQCSPQVDMPCLQLQL